jgi:hypothetical protein
VPEDHIVYVFVPVYMVTLSVGVKGYARVISDQADARWAVICQPAPRLQDILLSTMLMG